MRLENAHGGAVGAAAAAQDCVAAGALDGGDDGAGRCGAFDEDELVCEAGFYFGDSFPVLSVSVPFSDECWQVPGIFCMDPETSCTQWSQVMGT